MKIESLHPWDLSAREARLLQTELATKVRIEPPSSAWRTIAACDVSFDRFGTELYAAIVVMEIGSAVITEQVGIAAPAAFPYVPGLLSFREAPALIEAFSRLQSRPDVVLCDGQGIAHPRRLGIASHLGLWLGLPTVGCAKSRLFGTYREPGPERGDYEPLFDGDQVLGAVMRTRARVAPLFVSPGHLCDELSARNLVMATTGKLRLPVPSRAAHDFVNQVRRNAKSQDVLNDE